MAPPRYVVCGSTATNRAKLAAFLCEKYGLMRISSVEKSAESNDATPGEDDAIQELKSRLKAAEEEDAARGWLLDDFPVTNAQAKGMLDAGIVPQKVFHIVSTEATEEKAAEDAEIVNVLSATCQVIPIVDVDNAEALSLAVQHAIDVPEWVEQLQAVPVLHEQPQAVGDLVQATLSLPQDKQQTAMNLFLTFFHDERGVAILHDASSTVLALDIFTRVSKPTQEVIASQLPPELQSMLPMVERLPTQALVTMAPLAQEIIQESKSGAIQPATAVKVHTAFFDLPEKDRNQLIRLLPPKEKELVTHVVETTEGLSPRGVENIVSMVLQNSGSTTQTQSGSPLPAPSRHDPSYGAIDMPEPLTQNAFMTKLALTATKAHGRRLLRWVQSAPTSLRVLSFLSALLLAAAAAVAFVFDLLTGHVWVLIINCWIVFFAALLLSLEVKITAIERHVSTSISSHFPLLATVTGRGLFLLFVSMLSMSLVVKASWQNALLFASGVLGLIVSLWSVSLGTIAFHQFNLLRERIESVGDLKRIFEAVDVDQSGELDLDGLDRFCHFFHWPIDRYYLETILRDLDLDNTNGLSLNDLQVWWSQAQIDTTVSVQSSMKTGAKPTSALKSFNLACGVLTVITGAIGNVATLHNETHIFGQDAVYVVLNLWVMMFGALVVVLEVPPSWLHLLTEFRLFITENFARFLQSIFGRSLFYFFVGTFTISAYQNDSVVLPIVMGVLWILMAGINSFVGKQAKAQFLRLAKAVDVSTCARLFAERDTNGDGTWSYNELDQFCNDCELHLTLAQWELLVAELDPNCLGHIALPAFTLWVEMQHRNMDIV